MALENLVDGMTGLQMANTIKNNFDKVLDAESAENKAENAGKSIKTDYDATRYIELQLADGTPVKMKMDVFCQAIAPVVAGVIGNATIQNRGLMSAKNYKECSVRWSFVGQNATKLYRICTSVACSVFKFGVINDIGYIQMYEVCTSGNNSYSPRVHLVKKNTSNEIKVKFYKNDTNDVYALVQSKAYGEYAFCGRTISLNEPTFMLELQDSNDVASLTEIALT